MLELAKPTVDIALATGALDPVRAFWEAVPGLRYERSLPTGAGMAQHRFSVRGTVLKINTQDAPLPPAPPGGYVELVLACEGAAAPRRLADPDGNRLALVPPGQDGVTQAAIRVAVRDLARHRRFYTHALDLREETPGRFRAGETLILPGEAADAPADAGVTGPGWRYITLQVMRVVPAFRRAIEAGARAAPPPTLMDGHARYAMIRDPDGNWIELSQRADLAGTLAE